jgi:hypothetical protein
MNVSASMSRDVTWAEMPARCRECRERLPSLLLPTLLDLAALIRFVRDTARVLRAKSPGIGTVRKDAALNPALPSPCISNTGKTSSSQKPTHRSFSCAAKAMGADQGDISWGTRTRT